MIKTKFRSSVISKINNHMFTGKIEIEKHHPILFIVAPNVPYDDDCNTDIELTTETYVKVSALPKQLQVQIRDFIRKNNGSMYANDRY